VANVLPFWAVPDAIQRWKNSLKHCRRILDQFLASIGAKYTSGSIIFVADVLPFWAMPDAIRKWKNILKHCRRILDNFPASIGAKYTSSSNFTISWPIIFVANVLPFWAVPNAIRRWENILKHCRRIWIIFRQAYLQIIFPAAFSWFLDTLFLWPMYCHFGLCPMHSGSGKTFWNTANTFWLIFWQAYLQITFLAAISSFHDPLFLLLMYCHFGRLPKAIRVWGNILKHCQSILDHFPAGISAKYTCCHNFIISWCIFYYGDLPPLCAVLRVIQVPETPVFVDKFLCTFTWFIYSYSQYSITISKSRKSTFKFTFPQHNYGQD